MYVLIKNGEIIQGTTDFSYLSLTGNQQDLLNKEESNVQQLYEVISFIRAMT